MIRLLKGFFYFKEKEEKKIISKVKVNGNDRSDVELIHSNGVIRRPQNKEVATVIEDTEEKKYYVLKTDGSTTPDLEAGEVAVFFDKDNYLKITENKKVKIQMGSSSLFDVLSELIEQINKNKTLTQIGLQTISPADVVEMNKIKTKLGEIME